jgi:23S rRNA pseudouridine1911/1915/1917 synthase
MHWTIETPTPRLDRFLVDQVPELPRSQWETWIRSGRVRVNGEPVTKPGTRLSAGTIVETEPPEFSRPALHLLPEAIDLPTLFEDERLWIVDKPAGMVVHPGPGHASGTVLNALLARIQELPAEPVPLDLPDGEDEEIPIPYPGLVHRLDRFTTGCLALAKDAAAQTSLQAQFKARTVEKRYLALVRDGRRLPEMGSLLVDAPIARHRLERLRMVITESGRPSQTRVRVLARSRGLALVECELLTGRTHQIRVHLKHLGAPILGDPIYGGPCSWMDEDRHPFSIEHPLLHAWKLALGHPSDGRLISVKAALPAVFLAALKAMGLAAPS